MASEKELNTLAKNLGVDLSKSTQTSGEIELLISAEAQKYMAEAYRMQSDYEKFDDFAGTFIEEAFKARKQYIVARAIAQFEGAISKYSRSHPALTRNEVVAEIVKSKFNRELRDKAVNAGWKIEEVKK